MSTIAFITRDQAGTKQHGEFLDGGSVLDASSVKDVSLNLRPADVQSYQRIGNDLQLVTFDGQTLVLDNFFAEAITGEKNLFLSDDGAFTEVVLESRSEGVLFPTYEPLDVSGKWSAYDDLVFLDLDRVEPVIAPLVAAPAFGGLGAAAAATAGVVGAGALVGGGSGDDGDNGDTSPEPTIPTVDDPDASFQVSGQTTDPVVITGTGVPGSTVDVTIGDQTQSTTVNDDGTWGASFDPDALPADGDYSSTVQVVDPDGTVYDLDGPSVAIDTTPPPVAVTEGTQSVGEVINAEEHNNGTVIAGTGEANAQVAVTINGTTRTTTVAEDGSWSLTFAATEIETGEYETAVTVTSTDAFGNSTTLNEILEVDTIAPVVDTQTVEGDDQINAAEASDGVTLSGTGEAGAAISVEFMGEVATTTVGADGTWSVDYAASVITAGEYDSSFSVTSTDAAGNSSTTTHEVAIDTIAPNATVNTVEGDDVVNAAEASDGVSLGGTGEAGASVEVTFLGTTRTTTVAADGSWSLDYAASEIPSGESSQTATVVMTDAAGNTGATVTHTVEIDTVVEPLTVEANQTADDVVSRLERAGGVTLSGTVEPGSTVVVEINSVQRAAVVDANGNWTVDFTGSDLPEGAYTTTASITATDTAGNSRTIDESFSVDTFGAPEYHGLSTESGSIDSLTFEDDVSDMSVFSVDDSGNVANVVGVAQTDEDRDPFSQTFGEPQTTFFIDPSANVPDGTTLVVSGTDTAGNMADTLLITEDGVTGNVLENSGFSGFDIEILDLDESADANIVITEDNIKALSQNSDTLVVHGGTDDTITVTGATASGTRTIEGETFNVYTVGNDGATLYVEEDVNVVI